MALPPVSSNVFLMNGLSIHVSANLLFEITKVSSEKTDLSLQLPVVFSSEPSRTSKAVFTATWAFPSVEILPVYLLIHFKAAATCLRVLQQPALVGTNVCLSLSCYDKVS
jgi:hypothetical protein